MPRGRPRRIASTEPPEKQLDDLDEIEVGAFINSLGPADILFKLYKYDDRNRQLYLEDFPIESLKSGSVESIIRDTHGGGSYLIRAVRDGKFVKGGSKVLHIADTYEAAAPGGQEYSGGGLFQSMMAMQQRSSDQTLQMMQHFNSSMMTLITAIISGNKSIDPIQLAQLFKGDNSGGAGQLAMVKELLGIAKELQPGGAEPPDPTMALLGQIVPGLLARGNGSTPAATAAHQPAANPPAQLPPATRPEPQTQEKTEMLDRQEFLRKLKSKAKSGASVEFWADYIEENQDEPACKWISDVVNQYPWVMLLAGLSKADPEIGQTPYLEWFGALYEQLRPGAETEAADAGKSDTAQ